MTTSKHRTNTAVCLQDQLEMRYIH